MNRVALACLQLNQAVVIDLPMRIKLECECVCLSAGCESELYLLSATLYSMRCISARDCQSTSSHRLFGKCKCRA